VIGPIEGELFGEIPYQNASVGDNGRNVVYEPQRGQEGISNFELVLVGLVVALLLALAMPALLRGVPGANNIDAKANLANALVAARADYLSAQAYSYDGAAYPTISFLSEAPEFDWITGSCAGNESNCVSEQVVDVDSAGDGQGIVVAAWSSETRTCWYAVDLETVPRALAGDRTGAAFDSGANGNRSVSTAGVYYGRSAPGSSSCKASAAVTATGNADWGSSPGSAGIVGAA
jgi:type II secretory pathway pseudopilin PulG